MACISAGAICDKAQLYDKPICDILSSPFRGLRARSRYFFVLPRGQCLRCNSPSLKPFVYHSNERTSLEPAEQAVHSAIPPLRVLNHCPGGAFAGGRNRDCSNLPGGPDGFQSRVGSILRQLAMNAVSGPVGCGTLVQEQMSTRHRPTAIPLRGFRGSCWARSSCATCAPRASRQNPALPSAP